VNEMPHRVKGQFLSVVIAEKFAQGLSHALGAAFRLGRPLVFVGDSLSPGSVGLPGSTAALTARRIAKGGNPVTAGLFDERSHVTTLCNARQSSLKLVES
jgi:hypothetical protein